MTNVVAFGRCATRRSGLLRTEPEVSALREPAAIAGPSERFIGLTRNVELAHNPPTKFIPTVKNEGDIVL